MARRFESGHEESPLDGLGAPRRGAHRTGAGVGALLSSLAAVLAVVVVLGGLYLAFGSDTDDPADSAADPVSSGDTRGATPEPTPSPRASSSSTAAPSRASATPTPAASGTPSTAPESPAAQGGTAAATGSPEAEGPGAGDEAGLQGLPVVVLNQSGRPGLASRTAASLRSAGWTVSSVGNFRGAVPSTTIYYPDGALAAAQALADQLPGPDRVRPVFSGISATKLTVILV